MGCIDAFQFGIDCIAPPIGEIANEFLDIAIGIGLFLFCWYKGVLDMITFIVVLGTFFIEQLTGGGSPFWVGDVYAIRKRAEANGYLTSDPTENEENENNALNYNEVRQPIKTRPLNENNVRQPSIHL
jgi:hypothetical protein